MVSDPLLEWKIVSFYRTLIVVRGIDAR